MNKPLSSLTTAAAAMHEFYISLIEGRFHRRASVEIDR